jgi:hypothetical protein
MQYRTRSRIVAAMALCSAMLVTPAAVAAQSYPHGPGSPEWTRHLELEYGDSEATGAAESVPHGPGSATWSRHLELEYADRTAPSPVEHGPGSPTWTRHLELEYGG